MNKQIPSTRTCVACGQKKPLFAFLEMSGEKGHRYGEICATCRGAGLGRKKNPEIEAAERSGGSTRFQIDNKSRIQEERDRKENHKHSVELDYEEKLKKDETETDKKSEKEIKEEAEKKHREDYLGINKKDQTKTKDREKQATTQEAVTEAAEGQFQEKARTSKDFFTENRSQEMDKKKSGLSAAYIAKHISATGGRSARSLFGNLLGDFLRQHTDAQEGKPATPAAEQKTTAPVVEQKRQGAEAPKADAKDNPAAEFVRSNFMKR